MSNSIEIMKHYNMNIETLSSYIIDELEGKNECTIDNIEKAVTTILTFKLNLSADQIEKMSKRITNKVMEALHIYADNNVKLSEKIKPILSRIALTDAKDLENISTDFLLKNEYSIGIVVEAIKNEEIESDKKELVYNRFKILPLKIKEILYKIKMNCINNAIGFIEKDLDFWSKSMMGLTADLIGGNLFSKAIYNPVVKNEEMYNKIKQDGIIHFTNPEKISSIINSGKIKASSVLLSLGKKKSYFFGGIPSFKDLTVNIYSYNVMKGIRIRPTDEQIKELLYREYNDKAVAKAGDFEFDSNQIEEIYCGLKMDDEGKLYYEEITEEEAKNYQIPNELKYIYNGDGSISHKIICNLIGFYYEYENYIQLLSRIKNSFIEKLINENMIPKEENYLHKK